MPIQQAFENSRMFTRDGLKAKAIDDKIMEFIALDDLPFSVVEDQGFCQLTEPRYTLPDTFTV